MKDGWSEVAQVEEAVVHHLFEGFQVAEECGGGLTVGL